MKQTISVAVLALFIAVFSFPACASALKKGDKAPDFTATTLDGGMLALSSFRGGYVVLDFWGSWCRNCILGFPKLVDTADKYGKQLQVIGVVCSDTPEKAKLIVEKKGLKWPNVISDENCDVVSRYGVTVYPTKVLIDPDGLVVGFFAGETDELYRAVSAAIGN